MNPTSAPPAASQALLTQSLSAGNGNPAVTATPPPGAIWHGECKLWWTGSERSHCGGCHITLSSLSAFERHRKGLRCNDPASVGLVPRQKQFGTLWGWPAPDDGGHAVFHGEAVTR